MAEKKRQIGTRWVLELEYVYLSRSPHTPSPFVSQVHPVECDKDGNIVEGVTVDLDRVHNVIQWKDGVRTVVAPGWIWRTERVIEVPLYEKIDPTVQTTLN